MKTLAVIALAATAILAAPAAHATVLLTLQSGADIYSQTGANSVVVVKSAFGGFDLSINSGVGRVTPSIDLGSQESISSATGGTITITLSMNDLMNPVGMTPFASLFTGNIYTGIASVTQASYLDASNVLGGKATALGTNSFSGAGVFARSITQSGQTAAPFALTEVVTVTFAGPGDISLDASLTKVAVPEPVSMGLLGAGLLGVAAVRRRNR